MKAFGSRRAQRYIAGGEPPPIITDGLVGWWPFDDGVGDTAADMSGSGNDGTLAAAVQWVSPGQDGTGYAVSFPINDRYVTMGEPPELSFAGAFTITGWIKIVSLGSSGALMSKGGYASNRGAFIYFGSSTSSIYFKGNSTEGGNDFQIQSTPLNQNQYYNVAGVFDGDIAFLYLDGNLINSSAAAGGNYMTAYFPFEVGGLSYQIYDSTSVIDDVRVYNRGLSAGEVGSIAAGIG